MTPQDSLFEYLDLRGIPCPLNFIRCKLLLESLQPNQFLKIDVDKGEPEESIISGLSEAGHNVKIISDHKETLTMLINYFEH